MAMLNEIRGIMSLNFESLAEVFMQLVDDRYPTAERVLQNINSLVPNDDSIVGINKKIIIIGAVRDMIKKVSPNYVYRSLQHRDELYNAIIEASEQLEDRLEELEDQEAGNEAPTTTKQEPGNFQLKNP